MRESGNCFPEVKKEIRPMMRIGRIFAGLKQASSVVLLVRTVGIQMGHVTVY